MHYLFLVHVLQCAGDLPHVLPNGGLIERVVICRVLFDKFFEISFLSPFSDDVEFIVLDEGVDIFDYVGMVERFHQLHLLQALIP